MVEGDGTEPGHHERRGRLMIRIAMRVIVIAAFALAVSWLVSTAMDLATRLPEAAQGPMQTTILITAILVYALLIAIPFVPGIEIGFALLIVQGVSIVPAVYLATLTGLLLAYFIGRLVPVTTLESLFRDLKLRRAAQLMADYAAMTQEARQHMLLNRLPRFLAVPAVRYRYLTLALLINLPGNAFLGGGGGLMLASGLSRLFQPGKTILTLALCVLPVPVGFLLFGTAFLGVSQ